MYGCYTKFNAAPSYSELKPEVEDFHFEAMAAMAEDAKVAQEKSCCAAWKKKYSSLSEKHSKIVSVKNKLREMTNFVNQKYEELNKENESLKQAMGDLEVQVSRWKDEKEKESGIRVDLEDEVSALKEEIQLLKENDTSACEEGADEKLKECLGSPVEKINQMKDLLEKEKARADLQKENAEMQRMKADDALKKVEQEKNKVSEAQGLAKIERKRAEENRLLLEKLKRENDALKSKVDSERSKYEAADKKLEAVKRETIKERKRADLAVAQAEELRELAETNMKKAEEYKLLCEKTNMELDAVRSMLTSERSKSEAAEMKVEEEKQNTNREKKRAELAGAKAEEQKKIAETNLEKLRVEKNRADNLNQKLEEERTRVKKLEEELHGHICSMKLVEAAGEPNTGKIVELKSDVCKGTATDDAPTSQRIKVLLEKDQSIIKGKKRVNSETKKAKKHRKVAEEHKMMAILEKHRADCLSKKLEGYKLRLKELRKEPEELLSYRINADNSQRCNDIINETETVKLLKKQLKLEKMLSNHAKKATKLEVFRNNMLHQELVHLKQEFCRFQQRVDMLDDCFLNDGEGIYEFEKMGNQTFTRDKFYKDQFHGKLTSGIDSRLNHPCRGSKRNILQSSTIHSSSASISDQPLVESPERGTFSVITTARLGKEVSSLKLSGKKRMRYSENDVAKTENIRSPIRGNGDESTVGCSNTRIILDAFASVESLYSKGHKLHQQVAEKLTQLHGILNDQNDEPTAENLLENSCGKQLRPCKRRNSSYEEAIVIHPLHESGTLILHSDIDNSDALMHVTSPVTDTMKLDQHLESGRDDILVSNQCIRTESDDNAIYDYMKLLDLDDAADEKTYCRAIASPPSPTLPDIEFHGDEGLEVDNYEMLVYTSSQEGLPIKKDNLAPTSSADAHDMEKKSTNLLPNEHVSSQFLRKNDSVEHLKKTVLLQANHTHVHKIGVAGENVEILGLYGSMNDEVNILCERRMTSIHNGLLKCCIISSDNKDSRSILRILKATGSCMPQCSLLDSADIFLQSLLTTLNAEDITMKERVCVFFSIILQAVSEVEMVNSTNALTDDFIQSLASTTRPICSALSDVAFRRKFMDSCNFAELLALIEDFLQQRKVFVCADASAKTQVLCSPKLDLDLNGNAINLYEQAASAHQLVVVSSLLASICCGIDHIGLICEMSCNIFSMEKLDPALALAVLHAFAHTCGSKYFNLHQNTLAITVIKSLVTFLEKRMLSTNSEPQAGWSCSTSCPFSEDAMSMEDVASLLVNKLQVYGRSVSWKLDSHETVNPLDCRVCPHEEPVGDLPPTEVVSLSTTSDKNFFSFTDILSLVEILASFMGWDWTNDSFIGQFCEFLESHLMEDSSAAIIILLGQLGRLGVVASGYEGTGVRELREWISAILRRSSFAKLSLVTQFAFMNALLCLSALKFEEITQSKVEFSLALSKSIDADFVKKWFYSLSNEQQSLFRLQQTGSEINCCNRLLSQRV